MSPVDAVMPLLQTPWIGRHGEDLSIVPGPAMRPAAITNLEAHWTGILTPEMRAVLQRSCGLSGTPIGSIDFTGRWFPEEPLSIFRPSITLAIDDHGRRWIAELGKGRGLPGPVWCIFSRPEVALPIDRNLGDFLQRLHANVRRDSMSAWLTTLSIRARKLWASRHGRAIGVPVAFSRLREIRGWLAELPVNAWVYDLRSPGVTRGLPYGLMHERGQLRRCGRLLVFAFTGFAGTRGRRGGRADLDSNPGGLLAEPSVLIFVRASRLRRGLTCIYTVVNKPYEVDRHDSPRNARRPVVAT